MRIGLILSFVFHSALLGFALISFQNAKAFKPPIIESIPLDIVDVSELTKLKAGLKKAPEKPDLKKLDPSVPIAKQITENKKKKKPAPKRRVEPVAEKLPAEKVEKVPAKVKEKPKKVASKPKPKPKPKAKPKPKPKPKKIVKKKKKKRKFDEDKIAALLNKVPDKASSSSKLPDLPGAKKVKGNPKGKALTMSINEIDAFRRQVSQCWNPPVGGLGAENLKVKVRLRLRKDGSLKNQPKVLNRGSSPFFRAAADSATRAIWQCQPYSLPVKKYELWRDMIINFDPQHMLAG